MKSMPAISKARRTADRWQDVMDVSLSASSARREVVTPIAFDRFLLLRLLCPLPLAEAQSRGHRRFRR